MSGNVEFIDVVQSIKYFSNYSLENVNPTVYSIQLQRGKMYYMLVTYNSGQTKFDKNVESLLGPGRAD